MIGLHDLFNTFSSGSVDKPGPDGNTLLYKAAKNGNISEVRRLLKAGADPNIQNAHHLTPLHQAAYWGETAIVVLLLEHGAKADVDNGQGWTPLHSAAVAGGLKSRKAIIDLLLAHGADPEKTDKHGWASKDYMALWDLDVLAAKKLKEYMQLMDGQKKGPENKVPIKPSSMHTPKH